MNRFGIDFGGVIVKNRRVLGEDTDLSGAEHDDVAHEGVFEAVREIVSICDGQVWIVSKAKPQMQARTRSWLESVQFFSRTGLDASHIRFCLEREEKEGICKELETTHFIDDRIHVMQILRHTVPHLFLFGDESTEKFCPPWATFVFSWSRVVEILAESPK